MNVSRNAYFTSEYLEDLKRSPRSNRNGVARSTHRSQQVSPRSYQSRPSPRSNQTVAESIDPIENPDELMEEITPAELTYLSQRPPTRVNRQLVSYYDYYKPRSTLRSPTKGLLSRKHQERYEDDVYSLQSLSTDSEPVMPGRGDFSGYYIDQKRKYDEAKEVKPAFYTHKTFQDVFDKDKDERLNPIDVVFENRQENRDLNERRVLSKALKKVQKTVGMDDYRSYDYFEQLQRAEKLDLLPFLSEGEKPTKSSKAKFKKFFNSKKGPEAYLFDPVDDPALDGIDEFQESPFDKDSKAHKKSGLRSRWRFSKKPKGSGEAVADEPSTDEMPGSHSPPLQDLDVEEDVIDPIEEGPLEPVISPKEELLGPKEHFLPLWNTLLSWVVYERLSEPNHDNLNVNKIEELSESDAGHDFEGNEHDSSKPFYKKKLLNARRYKQILLKWNDPASNYLINPPKFLENRSKATSLRVTGDNALEFEVDFGEEDLADELVYNPETGQLEALVPSKISTPMVRLPLDPNGPKGSPVTIMSSVNKLIKNIKIMRILFAPIDVIADNFPRLQTLVIIIELGLFIWILYELSLLIDALCMAIKAVCAPMIAVGKFMNRIM